MNIIVGHTNLDLDAIGSMTLARLLFPDHVPVASRFIHPAARSLYNLYSHHLDFLSPQELAGKTIGHAVVVDTRSSRRVAEYFDKVKLEGAIEVFDHHPSDGSDIEGAALNVNGFGANTTYFALELAAKGVSLAPDDATIALAGIFADTGNFTHDNVRKEDFAAAEYLISQKASVGMVRRLLGSSLKEDHQVSLFHQLLNEILYQEFHGHLVGLSMVELDAQTPGLAAVVEKTFEVENVDSIFAVFSFRKEHDVLVIARSRGAVDVRNVVARFEGNGHAQAASALVKDRSGGDVFRELLGCINEGLLPAVTAEHIMTKDVLTVGKDWPLIDASKYLEEIDHTGAPVVAEGGKLAGFISLRNIMSGRKAGNMNAPVSAYMVKKIVTAGKGATIRRIEELFFRNNIGHLPIVDDGRLVGIVTRTDYLKYLEEGKG